MDRDDYISKLFIKNQDKLSEQPSDDLWSRLEHKLDSDMPVSEDVTATANKSVATTTVRRLKLFPYLAAASVAALLLCIPLMQQQITDNAVSLELVLEEPIALLVDDAEPYSDDEALIQAVLPEEKQATEVKEQEAKIVELVNKKIDEINERGVREEKVELSDITFVDEADDVEGSSVILIEAEEESQGFGNATYAEEQTLYKDDVLFDKNEMNYAGAVPQVSNTFQNRTIADEIITNTQSTMQPEVQKMRSESDLKNSTSYSRGGIVNSISDNKKRKKSSIARTNPKLHQFEFLLGDNVDVHEKEGSSVEKWTIKNNNTLSGKGYKLSSNQEIIFEESMLIQAKHQQIFFLVKFQEKAKAKEYMLTASDFERFEFTQSNQDDQYPDKIVIQRILNGYDIVISNSKKRISSDQQRYLENRNRVTNRGARRTLNFQN